MKLVFSLLIVFTAISAQAELNLGELGHPSKTYCIVDFVTMSSYSTTVGQTCDGDTKPEVIAQVLNGSMTATQVQIMILETMKEKSYRLVSSSRSEDQTGIVRGNLIFKKL